MTNFSVRKIENGFVLSYYIESQEDELVYSPSKEIAFTNVVDLTNFIIANFSTGFNEIN